MVSSFHLLHPSSPIYFIHRHPSSSIIIIIHYYHPSPLSILLVAVRGKEYVQLACFWLLFGDWTAVNFVLFLQIYLIIIGFVIWLSNLLGFQFLFSFTPQIIFYNSLCLYISIDLHFWLCVYHLLFFLTIILFISFMEHQLRCATHFKSSNCAHKLFCFPLCIYLLVLVCLLVDILFNFL